MASKIKHSFKNGALALIKGGWANRVGRVCSYWIGRNGIDVLIPENPSGNSPCSVALNVKNATKLIVNEIQTGLGLILDRAHPLELRTVKTTNESTGAVTHSYSMIYLPSLTLKFSGTDYTVTGLTALGNGWYNTGRKTGDFWLVEGNTANQLTLAAAASSDTSKLSYFVGSIGANSPWTVTQYSRAASGDCVVTEGGGGGSVESVKPLAVKCVTRTSGQSTVVDYWKIYLPSLIIGIGKTDYAIQTGTSTGRVSPITGEDGWYRLYGISTGNIFLNDASTEQSTGGAKNYKLVFSNSVLTGANLVSIQIAVTSFSDGVATIAQCENPVKGYLGMCDTEHDGTNTTDISGAMTNQTSTADFINAGQKLITKTWERGVSVLQHNTGTTNNPVWVNDLDADGNTQLCGVKLRMFTRLVRIVDKDYFLYRELDFDKNGMLRKVSEEKAAYSEYNGAY